MKATRSISSRAIFYNVLFLLLPGSMLQATPLSDTDVDGYLAVTEDFITGTDDAAGGIELRLGGLIIAKGTLSTSPALVSSDEGAGARMLWYPRKAAFRAGTVSGNQWNDANIGTASVALGSNTTASGSYSVAIGGGVASGYGAVALAGGQSTGEKSFAMADTYASGWASTTFGHSAYASGDVSFATGNYTYATGTRSSVFGVGSLASGGYSMATGIMTDAIGSGSMSMGENTSADSYVSVALGRYNVGGGNGNSWVSTDPLFEIGNGTSSATSNALTVYKNGNMDIQGVITCAPGGDVPMFGE